MSEGRPGPLTLAAFGSVALIGGSNFVAVRLSNRELPPFWGAGLRFALAGILLVVIAAVGRIAFPRGRALAGATIFGVLNFTAAYALMYWGLIEAPAALGGVVFGAVPLITFLLAVGQGIEAFRSRALVGALIAVSGVALMVGAPTNGAVPLTSFFAIVGAAICAAEATVLIKRMPPAHPISLNAVAMLVGAPGLLLLSLAFGETWAAPQRATTWYTLAYLIPIGSVALFILAIMVIRRWTASAASYQFVLFPIVSAVVGAVVAGEALTWGIAGGAILVIAGVWVGAFSSTPSKKDPLPAPAVTPPRQAPTV